MEGYLNNKTRKQGGDDSINLLLSSLARLQDQDRYRETEVM